jgi:putative DNA-invertase from lambdoid prophage Rac
MLTYIYIRVSTFDQALHGYSIEAQTKICLKYCEANGLVLGPLTNCGIPGVIVDCGRSAYKKKLNKRTGGFMLLGALKVGDTVIATATHRLFRNTGDMVTTMEHWVETGVNVRFTDYPMLDTHTANGKAMLSMFAVMAQMKSELMSARVKEANLYKATGGKPVKLPVEPLPQPFRVSVKNEVEIMQALAAERNAPRYNFTGTIRAYIRVSTRDQTVEQQRKCLLNSLPAGADPDKVVWYEDEGYSAFKLGVANRPAGKQMMQDIQAGDLIIVWRPDRIFRSVKDMADTVSTINDMGVSIFITETGIRTDTSMGRMMMSMLTVMAELESEEISRSTKQGMFVAIAENPALRAATAPKFLRSMKTHQRQKYYAFEDVLTAEDRRTMFMQFHLTHKNFSTRKAACRIVSNNFLKSIGLPPISGKEFEPIGPYIARLKKQQRTCPTIIGQKVLKKLKASKLTGVGYPINPMSVSRAAPLMDDWMRISKSIEGNPREKLLRTALACQCDSPEIVVELGKILDGQQT